MPMAGPLQGKLALVTGSSRNIGKAAAIMLARDGADVVINARSNADEAESTAAEIAEAYGVRSIAVCADCSDYAEVRELARVVRERMGDVDILVNNVGIAPAVPFLEMSVEDWEMVLHVSLFSAFYCTKEFLGHMAEAGWGRIINVGGQSGIRGTAKKAHNAAAKHGLIGFTRAIATEFGERGVTCNHVGPGHIDTSARERYYTDHGPDFASDDAFWEDWKKRIPLKRHGTAKEVAAAVRFLASEQASYITGQTLLVNGGMFYV
jgi:NAD(P)-dependent dehydrogenase (short-subunit alcohol dehydrogenase family)